MQEILIDKSAPILVEVESKSGVVLAAQKTKQIQKESAHAITSAMDTIYNTATRINNTIEALPVKPSQVEVEFGIKLVAETGAIIAKASGEVNFKVKLAWEGTIQKSSDITGSEHLNEDLPVGQNNLCV